MISKKPTAAKKVTTKNTVAKKTTAVKKSTIKKPVAKVKAKEVKPKLTVKAKSAKDLATKRGEPWVQVLSVELDPGNIGNGAFELDWNDIFVAKLIKAGYQGKEDADVVDNWFKTICRNIITEEYEQWEANQPSEERPRVIERKPIGGGRSELS